MSEHDSTMPPPPPGGAATPPPPPGGGAPPPPPSGPTGGGFGGGSTAEIPWEERDRRGFVEALVETVKLIATNPKEAFSRVRTKNDYIGPLIYGVILGTIGTVVAGIWRVLMGSIGGFGDIPAMGGGGGISALMIIILAPIIAVIGLFIGAGILHLCLMIVSGLGNSRAGFEGTFRVVAYAYTAQLAQIIPFIGGFIAAGWLVFLVATGFMAVHKTDQTKAWIAAVLPLALCCLCMILGMVFGGGLAFLGAMGAAAN